MRAGSTFARSGRDGRGASSPRSSSCSLRSRRTPRGGHPRRSGGSYGATAWPRSSTRRTGGSSSRTTRTSTCSLRRRSLEHTWSLAIEEQFYLLWPLVVVGCLRSAGAGERHSSLSRRRRGHVSSADGAARRFDPTRAYFGSDTRVHSLLVGALLAMLLERRRLGVAGAAAGVISAASAGWPSSLGSGVRDHRRRRARHVPRRLPPVRRRRGDRDHRRGATTGPGAGAPFAPAARVDRHDLVRPLPVALAGAARAHTGSHHCSGMALDALAIAVTVACATASYYAMELPIRRGNRAPGRAIAVPSAAAIAGVSPPLLVMATAATSPGPRLRHARQPARRSHRRPSRHRARSRAQRQVASTDRPRHRKLLRLPK